MPSPNLTDTVEMHGHRFRLHRATGFAASEAKAAWAQVAGKQSATMLALGAAEVARIAEQIVTPEQREAMAGLGQLDARRALALLGIVTCMDRGTMTPSNHRLLVAHFVLGWVDIEVARTVDGLEAKAWKRIATHQDLDSELDGSDDADVWTDLLWNQIPWCLGPTIAAAGT